MIESTKGLGRSLKARAGAVQPRERGVVDQRAHGKEWVEGREVLGRGAGERNRQDCGKGDGWRG